jgi:hypothetical protein
LGLSPGAESTGVGWNEQENKCSADAATEDTSEGDFVRQRRIKEESGRAGTRMRNRTEPKPGSKKIIEENEWSSKI